MSWNEWLASAAPRPDWRQATEWLAGLAEQLADCHVQRSDNRILDGDRIRFLAGNERGGGRWCLLEGDTQGNSGAAGVQRYTAPEQIVGLPGSCARTDLYVLGVMLYRLLAGRYPFRSNDEPELAREILEDEPQPPRQLAQDIPLEIERLCLQLLAKNPSARPADALTLSRELRHAAALAESADSSGQVGVSSGRIRQVSTATAQKHWEFSWRGFPDGTRVAGHFANWVHSLGGTVIDQTAGRLVWRSSPREKEEHELTTVLVETLTCGAEWARSGMDGELVVTAAELDATRSASLIRRNPLLDVGLLEGRLVVNSRSLENLRRWLRGGTLIERPGTWQFSTRAGAAITVSVGEADGCVFPNVLVGRAAPLAILKARWDQAGDGLGQVVLLIGDAGLGKTRLVRELLTQIETTTPAPQVIRWSCRPEMDEDAASPVVEFFRDPGTRARGLVEAGEWADVTSPRPRDRWQRTLLSWLKRLAAAAPTVLVVEDLQWADGDTLAFLHAFVNFEVRDRLLTVLTARPSFETPWGSRAHQTQVALGPLTRRHVATLYQSLTGEVLTDAELATLMSATGGVPLYVEGCVLAGKFGSVS
ncbi:MAG: AAA family ATPase [Pirellulales bacterium]